LSHPFPTNYESPIDEAVSTPERTNAVESSSWTAPPAPRPARSIAALVLLVVVFVIGVAVGSSGVLGRSASAGTTGNVATPAPAGQPGASPAASPNAPSDFGLFWEALDAIQKNFVGRADVDPRTLTYGAIRGMVDALGDTSHSVFLTPEQAQAEQNALDRNVVGIGVLLGEKDGQTIVVSVVPGSPAEAAGLKAGDIIESVNGTSTVGLTPDELVEQVRGEEGSQVSVTVQRPSTGEQLDFTITRAKIQFPSVSWTMVPGANIALIRFSQFAAGSSDELLAARDEALAAGATSIILDMRGNPGGYVDQATRSASQFLHGQTVYIRETSDGQRIPVLTDDTIPSTDVPLVLLIDQNTASSAEIMSARRRSRAARRPST
jgi:carboxyl-terminal processing protease